MDWLRNQRSTRRVRLAQRHLGRRLLAASAVPVILLLSLAGSAIAGSTAHASHGDRTAHTAAGSADQAVSFTVRPAILVVVDDRCQPAELWANIGRRPSAAELRATVGRQGSISGDAVDQACVDAALVALPRGEVHWTSRGEVWAAK